MADDFGDISYIDDARGSRVDLSRLHNFASDDDFEFDEDAGETDDESSENDETSGDESPSVVKTILVMLGLLIVLAAVAGAVWYFFLGGSRVVSAYLATGEEQVEEASADETEPSDDGVSVQEGELEPEGERTWTPIAEVKTSTVDAFLRDLEDRGFDVKGLDVEIPYDSEGNVYEGIEGISGVDGNAGEKSEAPAEASGDAASDNAATPTDATVSAAAANEGSAEEAVDAATDKAAESGDAKSDDAASDKATGTEDKATDKADTSSAAGTKFPILRASFKRADDAEFLVEWIGGDVKLRVIGDANGRLTRSVTVVESDHITGYDSIRRSLWSEDVATTSELVYKVREIDVNTMESVDISVAREAITGAKNISELLSRKADAAATDGATDGATDAKAAPEGDAAAPKTDGNA